MLDFRLDTLPETQYHLLGISPLLQLDPISDNLAKRALNLLVLSMYDHN
jgi:hypothetical protein